MSKILIIDVMSEAFRAFHALPKTIFSVDGLLINALLGFHNSLKRLVEEFKPALCVTAWTASGRTFRHELFPKYKSDRSIPAALAAQKPLISAYLNWLGIPQFSCDGFEADDVIATLTKHFAYHGNDVLIDTVDKDLWSLCTDSIKIWAPRTKEIIGPGEVIKRFQVQAAQIPDYLALTGDETDGIPRVPGISDRQAVSLLEAYGSVRLILDKHLDEIPELQRIKVQKNRDLLELNLQLTMLCNSVPLNLCDPFHHSHDLCNGFAQASAFLKTKELSFISSVKVGTQYSLWPSS
jgi:5'-3' exonuclease